MSAAPEVTPPHCRCWYNEHADMCCLCGDDPLQEEPTGCVVGSGRVCRCTRQEASGVIFGPDDYDPSMWQDDLTDEDVELDVLGTMSEHDAALTMADERRLRAQRKRDGVAT